MIKKYFNKLFNYLSTTTTSQIVFVIVVSIIVLFLVVITPAYKLLDFSFYDFFMTTIKKPIKQNDSLLLVDIDDDAMVYYKIWPWPRYMIGDGIGILADFGARAAIFDIEFLEKSGASVQLTQIDKFKMQLQDKFGGIFNIFQQGINSSVSKKILEKAFNDAINQDYLQLRDSVDKISIDNDKYLADKLRYFGKVYGTVNMTPYYTEIAKDKVKEARTLKYLKMFGLHIKDLLGKKKYHPAITNVKIAEFPIDIILNNYKSVGFTKIFRDTDAETRSIRLFLSKDGYAIPQLSIAPFLDMYNITKKQIIFKSHKYILLKDVVLDPPNSIKKSTFESDILKKLTDTDKQTLLSFFVKNKNFYSLKHIPTNTQREQIQNILLKTKYKIKKDIKIPIVNNAMKINWPNGKFDSIFGFFDGKRRTHFSFGTLLNYKYNVIPNFEKIFGNNFGQMNSDTDEYSFYKEYQMLKRAKKDLEKGTLDDNTRIQYNTAVDDFLSRLQSHVSEENFNKTIGAYFDKEIIGYMQENNLQILNGSTLEEWKKIKEDYRLAFNAVREATNKVIESRKILKNLEGKICFIGLTGTGTTDIGETPFDREFKNVGTHPAVLNTILENNFIKIVPLWLVLIITILFFSFFIIILNGRKSFITAIVGFGVTLLTMIAFGVFYRFTNVYFSPVSTMIYGLFASLVMLVMKFLFAERDKSKIRNAFDKYLSPVVINDILSDPDKLDLGGETKNCTAIFTDIQAFSSISEVFRENPKGLVSLLNKYLSAMSDIILDNGGTVDKYEGDAIIAFFGAPVKMPDHPYRACLSSIRMKQIEKILNKEILAEGIISTPILTRIGINTGDMIVGNMGTEKKMDYTMMGHHVNLAARLEGVNKQYHIYQLISEYTNEKVKDKIISRKLDRVRVVNIKTPIRLFELIGIKGEVDDKTLESLAIFENALIKFEERNWKESLDLFLKTNKLLVDDGPTKMYIQRCKKFMKTPPAKEWDGVYNLTKK